MNSRYLLIKVLPDMTVGQFGDMLEALPKEAKVIMLSPARDIAEAATLLAMEEET